MIVGIVMGASIVLNVGINEGRIGMISNRIRHWSVPAHSNTTARCRRRTSRPRNDCVAVVGMIVRKEVVEESSCV